MQFHTSCCTFNNRRNADHANNAPEKYDVLLAYTDRFSLYLGHACSEYTTPPLQNRMRIKEKLISNSQKKGTALQCTGNAFACFGKHARGCSTPKNWPLRDSFILMNKRNKLRVGPGWTLQTLQQPLEYSSEWQKG
jgi:hypothetical protein